MPVAWRNILLKTAPILIIYAFTVLTVSLRNTTLTFITDLACRCCSVRPPKKSWKNISNLSGGEKTLSSLALVFALHHYRPTPLYVMDEIDAALDFKNVSIVANYIKVGGLCLNCLAETIEIFRKFFNMKTVSISIFKIYLVCLPFLLCISLPTEARVAWC